MAVGLIGVLAVLLETFSDAFGLVGSVNASIALDFLYRGGLGPRYLGKWLEIDRDKLTHAWAFLFRSDTAKLEITDR
jgi:hypothetical protein